MSISVCRTRKASTCATAFLLGPLLSMFSLTPSVRAEGRDSVAARTDYRTKCAICHGPDGSGSTVGKSMKVPDLRSQTVQKKPDSELSGIISNGKGAMPSFKSSLSDAQIQALVAHVRAMSPKK